MIYKFYHSETRKRTQEMTDKENTAEEEELEEEEDSGAVSTGPPAKKSFLDPEEEEFRKRLEEEDKDDDINKSESRKGDYQDDGELYLQPAIIPLTYNIIQQTRWSPQI